MPDSQLNAQTQSDLFDPARARALQAALGQEPTIDSGDPLPPFFHQIYFWDAQPPHALGRDGHPRTGTLIPDVKLTRRMWAAGKLVFHRPLLAGTRAERVSTVESVTQKAGRSGPLAFVKIRHDIKQRHALAVTEWQDLVYREDIPQSMPENRAAPTGETATHQMQFNSTLLFRYSALTFNGHRIHYDETYARQTEGYDGLVVHGPLIAHVLMQFTQAQRGQLRGFSYRASSPLMHTESATFCCKDRNFWAKAPDGRLLMLAEAS